MKKLNISGIIITCIGIFAISMVAWTVYKAVTNPVQMENLYQNNYHIVDQNFNTIKRDISLFDAKYKLKINPKKLFRGTNQILISIKKNKNQQTIKNAKINILLTRPHTNNENKNIQMNYSNNQYKSDTFDIQNLGRYQLRIKIEIDNLVVYKEYNFFIEK